MKITEEEYAENRRHYRWIDRMDLADIIKLVAGLGILVLIRLFIMHYF